MTIFLKYILFYHLILLVLQIHILKFLYISVSAVDAAGVNPIRIKTLLANGLIKFSISDNSVFGNGPRSVARNPPDCN